MGMLFLPRGSIRQPRGRAGPARSARGVGSAGAARHLRAAQTRQDGAAEAVRRRQAARVLLVPAEHCAGGVAVVHARAGADVRRFPAGAHPVLRLERSCRVRGGALRSREDSAGSRRAAVSPAQRSRHRLAAAARLGRSRGCGQALPDRVLLLGHGRRGSGSARTALRAPHGAARSAADVLRRGCRVPSGLVVRTPRRRLRSLRWRAGLCGAGRASRVACRGGRMPSRCRRPGRCMPNPSSSFARSSAIRARTSPSCTRWRRGGPARTRSPRMPGFPTPASASTSTRCAACASSAGRRR